MTIAIKFENVSKQYRLGEVGTGTLSHDLHRAWARFRGKPDPFAKVGIVNNRTQDVKISNSESYVWALRDITFEVNQGQIIGIIGPNGAGKSTLLKLLSRVTAQTTGEIKANGRIVSLLEVGTGFHPELTGRENIYLNGAILGMRRNEVKRRLEEIVDFSGCAQYIDTPVKRYSSGMAVRLGFSVAAHLECEILVVDEVLAVGDAEFQTKCIGKMQDVGSSGRTILFVSHNMASISAMCERCIVFQNGRLVKDTSAHDAIAFHLSGTRSSLNHVDYRFTDNFRNYSKNKEAYFEMAEVCSVENGSAVIRMGEGVIIKLQISSSNTIREVNIGAAIYNDAGIMLVGMHSEVTANRRFLLHSDVSTVVELEISSLNLMSGLYSINFFLQDCISHNELDLRRNTLTFKVEANDVFGTGRLKENQGIIYLPVVWRDIVA